MGRTAPRAALRKMLKNEKSAFRLLACTDLLVYLNFLVFLRRLAEEARTNAFQNRSRIIKPEHIILAAKVVLKKSRG
ncbi:centromere protein W [Neopsephotus bourkii]|uniref:centromere protein W n=1 Tax=Neopsephotus bourkii TaxID=309878 RepID=UPI002AA594A0|nr:centromere protein W [Neopsephotus bourkii]